MGILNKIKGIFMEEVEEVVDEDTKALEKIKEKPPVAKKIETPREEKEEKTPVVLEPPVVEPIVEEESYDHTKEFSKPIEVEEIEHRFPMDFDDKDFEMDERKDKLEVKEELPKEEPVYEEVVESPVLYHEKRVDKKVEYEYEYEEPTKAEAYVEKAHSKTGFQRSPIISPVWGILDKNYRKEEIVSKREIRLTTNNKKADLDLVREKAYGDLANDITESIHEEEKNEVEVIDDDKEEDSIKDNLLYDLSENARPSVKVVTMGDAEEYFNELGLEYNVDYKVAKEEPAEGKEKIIKDEKVPVKIENKKEEVEEDDLQDDELINLIDAMYESK